MYNSKKVENNASQTDAKYTVADILSSMANGEIITPTFAEGPSIPSFSSTTHTGLTPTLTPTTLANIEQSFIELSSLAPTSTTATISAQGYSRQSGFVPPVIDSSGLAIKREYYSDDDGSDEDWMPTGVKKMRGPEGSVIEITPQNSPASNSPGPRRHTGPRPLRRNEHLTPQESEKRRVRRERNKVAAAKCRQRRVDHTNILINETENLEEQKASLENEIQTLQQQKEQFEFLLKAHTPMCSAKIESEVKTELYDAARPNSLSLAKTVSSAPLTLSNITPASRIALSTPSSGVFTTLSLDVMADGHTGLTPLTGGPSCSSETPTTDSALVSPTTLITL